MPPRRRDKVTSRNNPSPSGAKHVMHHWNARGPEHPPDLTMFVRSVFIMTREEKSEVKRTPEPYVWEHGMVDTVAKRGVNGGYSEFPQDVQTCVASSFWLPGAAGLSACLSAMTHYYTGDNISNIKGFFL